MGVAIDEFEAIPTQTSVGAEIRGVGSIEIGRIHLRDVNPVRRRDPAGDAHERSTVGSDRETRFLLHRSDELAVWIVFVPDLGKCLHTHRLLLTGAVD